MISVLFLISVTILSPYPYIFKAPNIDIIFESFIAFAQWNGYTVYKAERKRGTSMQQLPIGIDDFKKLRDNCFYYVDKSLFIKEILDKHGEVNVFTRPRRFGKTLTLSMLKYYFEKDIVSSDQNTASLFQGLKIMDAGENYIKHMQQYPVIYLSLKSAKQPDYDMAYESITYEIAEEFRRHNYILESSRLLEEEKEQFIRFRKQKASKTEYTKGLYFLTSCLKKVYDKNVIVLLDEYDVPLENAWLRGFYDRMADFIRSLLESLLKTNKNLEFSVITGCLRISRESIFTGLNNLDIISILNSDYAEYFGFTEPEVIKILSDFQITEKQEEIRSWYNGYLFGNTDVYNPWSVINYVKTAVRETNTWPKAYWANTSSNDIVKKLVEHADHAVRQELEILLSGKTIEKPVHEDITYSDIEQSQDNLWNFLFFTGYLKKVKERFEIDTVYLSMSIPNAEVKYIYKNTITDWFNRKIHQKNFSSFYQALISQDAETIERELSRNLMETISFYDYKEDYYHGFTAGLLKSIDGCIVKSNRESGLGRNDIMLLTSPYEGIAVIIELKTTDTLSELEAASKNALAQIKEKKYDAELRLEGYHTFCLYGIAFYKKICKVSV